MHPLIKRGAILKRVSGGPITPTHLTAGINETNVTGAITASVNPAPNYLQLIALSILRTDFIFPVFPSSVSGCGLTWEFSGAFTQPGLSNFAISTFVYRALGAASPGSVTIVLPYTAERVTWSWDQFDGIDQSGSNGSGAIAQTMNATGGPASTVPNFTFPITLAPNNGTYLACVTSGMLTGAAPFTVLGGQPGTFDNINSLASTVPVQAPSLTCDPSLWGLTGIELKRG